MSRLISVLIPAYNRPERLARCLEALAAQTLPLGRFEVVVCDDGSAVPLAPLADAFAGRLPLTVVRQENAGPAAARNTAARAARGEAFAFTDDDCLPAPDWLARLADRVASHPEHLIGGAIENALPDDAYATATQLVGDAVADYYERHGVVERFFSTSNLLVPAEGFRRLGGFSEAFPRAAGEDYDFCARWHQAGLPSVYAPEAVVRHAHGHTLRSFCRQHFDYGRGLLRVRQRRAQRAAERVRFERPGFYGHLLRHPLRQGHGARGWWHAALVLLSQAMTAAGGAREALLGGRWGREAPRLDADMPASRVPGPTR
jgi:GT2 family glycosyltransferase